MTRLELIQKIENRKKQISISIENLARLSNLGVRTVNRFFAGDDVKLSTIERITNLLGLDFAGNEVVPLNQLQKQRAKEKALFMASLVQSTSALEVQGLEEESLKKIIDKFEKEFLQGQYKNRLWVA
jgi:transcriptional regulator with XRE-family HTH domain